MSNAWRRGWIGSTRGKSKRTQEWPPHESSNREAQATPRVSQTVATAAARHARYECAYKASRISYPLQRFWPHSHRAWCDGPSAMTIVDEPAPRAVPLKRTPKMTGDDPRNTDRCWPVRAAVPRLAWTSPAGRRRCTIRSVVGCVAARREGIKTRSSAACIPEQRLKSGGSSGRS
jgi:hypothetical protein